MDKKGSFTNIVGLVLKTIIGNMVLSFFLFGIFFIIANDWQGTMIAHFGQENIVLEFQGGYYPDKVKCTVSGEWKIFEKELLFDDCGEFAWIEKISATEKGKDDNTIIEENFYYHKYTIDIADMHKRGSYTIEISYVIDKTEYRIYNMFYYDGEYDYAQTQMKTNIWCS